MKPEGQQSRNQRYTDNLVMRIAIVCALILVSAILGIYFHSVLHTEIIYTHFIYIPIVLASMWWGRRGILVALLLAAVLFSLHLFGIAMSPLWNDLVRILFFIVVALCISTLREAVIRGENALRLSEKKYRLLIDESFSGILVYREDRILFTNSRLSEILQYGPDKLVQKSIWDLIYKDDRFKIQRLISKIEQKGPSLLHCECRFVREDKELIWADVARSDTIYEGAPAVLMNIFDITERKDIEKKRQELSELAKTQEEQLVHSSRLAELGEMAAAISHELNQPLTGIRNYASNAQYMIEQGAGDSGDVRDNLRLISEQVDRASKILNQMRELARRSELHVTTLGINKLIQECVEFLMPQMRLSEVEVRLDLAEDLPEILGDWVRLEQVFLNLLTNARQAMENVQVRVLEIATGLDSADDSFVVTEITDTGVGFTEEQSPKLFAPFYTTKKPGEGTGLGLSISLRIIRDHGGAIEALGRPGRGATFRVRLPHNLKRDPAQL